MSVIQQTKYFVIEQHDQNADLRIYHSRLRLLDDGATVQGGNKGVMVAQTIDGEIIPLNPVLEIILGIEGVVCAEVLAHRVSVMKSPAFEWDKIHGQMMAMWDGIEIAVESTQPDAVRPWKAAINDSEIREFLEQTYRKHIAAVKNHYDNPPDCEL